MNKIIIIYGPTAVGKSSVAVELAKKINAEIISADSMQIYKDLNIGSAKITEIEMQGIEHHLINIKSCLENYSVYEFVCDCKTCIEKIQNKGKNVIIVGGTGLYLKALVENYNYCDTNKNDCIRQECEDMTNEQLAEFITKNGICLDQNDLNNTHRLKRKYEIIKCGKKEQTKNDEYDKYIIFGLTTDREIIYDRIDRRVDKMVQSGLIDELKYLILKGATLDNQSMKAIGYKELLPYINNEKTLGECLEVLKQKTRNYAKRQLTFFNQFKNLIKIEVDTIPNAVDKILKELGE